MYTIDQGYLTVDSLEVYYELYKQNAQKKAKYTLVLLHDSLGCVTLWRDWPSYFAAHLECDVLVYDRVGYGKSQRMPTVVRSLDYLNNEATFLDKMLDVLDIKRVCLFGYSDGGSIALLYGALFPLKTKGIICIAGHIFVEQITIDGVSEFKQIFLNSDLPARLEKYHPNKVQDVVDAWVDTWTSERFKNWSVEHLMDGIVSPLLFIQGDMDQYGSLDQITRTLARVKGVNLSKIYPGATHNVHKEKAKEIRTETLEFINQYVKGYEIKD